MPTLSVVKNILPSFSKITDAVEIEHYCGKLLCLWHKSKKNKKTPFCNPISVSRSMLPDIKANPFFVTLKSDGIRYIMYCTTRPGSTYENPLPVAIFIDRCKNMYEVDVVAVDDVFIKETIIEGELVWKQPEQQYLMYLAFDCIYLKGEHVGGYPFEKRLSILSGLLQLSEELAKCVDVESKVSENEQIVVAQYEPCVVIKMKTFVEKEHVENLWLERTNVAHRVDGIILQRKDLDYTSGTASNWSVLKWKDSMTIDLAGEDLCTCDRGKLPDAVHGRTFVLQDSKIKAFGEDDVVEYLITAEAKKINLFAIRRRNDKMTANTWRTVESTIQDAIDDVKISELV